MPELITELQDNDIETQWLTRATAAADDDATDPSDSDDDASDAGDADDDATDPGGADDDASDA
jgi:hypothetical protein